MSNDEVARSYRERARLEAENKSRQKARPVEPPMPDGRWFVPLDPSVPTAAGRGEQGEAVQGGRFFHASSMPRDFFPRSVPGGVEIPLVDVGPPMRSWEPPLPARDLHQVAREDAQWIWNGYLARSATTLLTSLWKSGKTTLLAHLLAAMAKNPLTPISLPQGGEGQDAERSEFCGRSLSPVKTLVVSEESQAVWAQRVKQLNIEEGALFCCRPLHVRPDAVTWFQLVQQIAAWVKEMEVGLVVFDPLANFVPGEENVAGAMLEFLMPLTLLTKQNAAVLLLHHPRKSDGTEGRSSRGSGALTGYVDIIMEMRRANAGPDTRLRVLSAYSRYEETPGELIVELGEDGSGYRMVGSRFDLRAAMLRKTVVTILGTDPHGMTIDELRLNWPEDEKAPSARTLERFLNEGLGKSWTRSGSGLKGSPFRYFLIPEPKSGG